MHSNFGPSLCFRGLQIPLSIYIMCHNQVFKELRNSRVEIQVVHIIRFDNFCRLNSLIAKCNVYFFRRMQSFQHSKFVISTHANVNNKEWYPSNQQYTLVTLSTCFLVMQGFDVLCFISLNNLLNKQSICWSTETPIQSLDDTVMLHSEIQHKNIFVNYFPLWCCAAHAYCCAAHSIRIHLAEVPTAYLAFCKRSQIHKQEVSLLFTSVSVKKIQEWGYAILLYLCCQLTALLHFQCYPTSKVKTIILHPFSNGWKQFRYTWLQQ